MLPPFKQVLRTTLPVPASQFLLALRHPADWPACTQFLCTHDCDVPISTRLQILKRVYAPGINVDSARIHRPRS